MRWPWLGVLAWLVAPVAAGQPSPAATAAFAGSLGVNTHIVYKDGAYADAAQVVRDLRYLGIHQVRDGIVDHWGPDTASLADYVTLARAGVTFDLVVSHRPDAAPGASFVQANLATLAVLARAMPHAIVAVEGPNEINNWPVTSYHGMTGVAAALAAQHDLAAAVHADPALRGVAVYDLTGRPHQAGLAGRADFANQHPYPHNAMQPGPWIASGFAEAYDRPGDLPKVITETGSFTLPPGWPPGRAWWQAGAVLGVDEATQAKSILASYAEAFAQGVSRTYIYQLLDEKPDPAGLQTDMHYGLFRFDHTPKPAAVAIHNLTTILASSPHGRAGPVRLGYGLAGLPATGRALLLRRGDGGLLLAAWNRVPFWRWDAAGSVPVTSPAVPVTLTLAQPADLALYDPLASPVPVRLAPGATAFTFDLVDHLVLLAVAPPPRGGLTAPANAPHTALLQPKAAHE